MEISLIHIWGGTKSFGTDGFNSQNIWLYPADVRNDVRVSALLVVIPGGLTHDSPIECQPIGHIFGKANVGHYRTGNRGLLTLNFL
jgi:hypothetical protein